MDIERFQHQKVIDLKETLAAYCVLQFKLARKVDVKFDIFYSFYILCVLNLKRLHSMSLTDIGSPSLATHQRLSRKYAVNMFLMKQTVTEQ